jgi:hypothetical protein
VQLGKSICSNLAFRNSLFLSFFVSISLWLAHAACANCLGGGHGRNGETGFIFIVIVHYLVIGLWSVVCYHKNFPVQS